MKKSGWLNSDVLDQPQENENHAGKFQKYHQLLLSLGKVKEYKQQDQFLFSNFQKSSKV